MPNTLAPPELLCPATNSRGNRCGGVKMRGRDHCWAHAPDHVRHATDPKLVVPSLSLSELSALDFTLPDSLSRLRRCLIEHLAGGSLFANTASQIMRFAEAEAAAAPKSSAKSDDMVAKVLASTPPPIDE